MSESSESNRNMSNDQEEGIAILPIPAEHTQALIDFVERLDGSDDDVSGHMIPLGNAGRREYTMTKCYSTISSVLISDWTCGDSDINQS